MDLDLASLARAKGIRRRRVTLRPIVPTTTLENDLFSIYADGLKVWTDLAAELVRQYEPPAPITTDADGAQLQWLVDQAAAQADNTIVYQTERLGRWVMRVGNWHTEKTISGVRSAVGVDVRPYMRLAEIQPTLAASIRENVALIRMLNANSREKVEGILYDAFVNRRSKKDLTDALAKAMGTTKTRARRIASDQTHKLGIALTAYRNEQLGIKSYVWQTREDDRVRRVHRLRNGQKFDWSAPPPDGHPGFPINCRCLAEPVVFDDGP